ncbi:MAG TPA: FAD-binding protein [Pyrinomonadaceae bacterium]|jgi:FAD/FMN-containing dehydrogenase
MPKLTLKAARDLQSSFKGRITSSHEAQAEFRDKPTVLIPESIEDVERALRLAQAANRRVFVRSGRSISTTDVTKPAAAARPAAVAVRKPAAVSKPAAAIVSLEAFRDIDISKNLVTVGAAATTGDVAKTLAGKNLFLPLDDNRTQSVVSAVLSMGASPFLRSGTGFGPLRNAVVEAEVVPTEGVGAGRAKTLRNKALRDILAGDRPAVITKLVLDADAAKTDESDRWTQVWTGVYEPKTFAALCDALFGAGARKVPERNDLSVRVASVAYSMKLVIVRTTGHGDDKAIEAVVQAAFKKAKLAVLESREVHGSGSSVAIWVATGPGEAALGEILTRFGSYAAPRPFAKFRKAFLAAVDFALGVSPRTGRERAPRVRAWAELQLAPGGNVVARAEIFDAEADPKVAKEARDRMAAAIPADKASPTAAVARRALVRRAPTRAALRGVAVLPSLTPTTGFELTSSNRAGGDVIPCFKGDVFDKSDGQSYLRAIQQYAVSSYSQKVVQARMTPKFVAVPEDSTDVTLAVTFAANQGLKVVTRSGGHQYCGLSSGGSDTLLIDMRLFNSVAFSGVSPSMQVTVGPGVALKSGSTELRDNGVVFPHGECPLVNLGGHLQTGGIGHQLRSLGAALDWVTSFKMVTRNPHPQSPSGTDDYVERKFTRPTAGGGNGAPTDDDVFRAVLGGGPSSWGVLTEITLDVLSDSENPDSAGFSYPYPYLFGETKEGFRAAMEHFRQWADRQSKGELPPGIDLFLTVVSGDFPRPPVLLVEIMCTDKAGLPEITAVIDAVDAAVPWYVRDAAYAASSVSGATPLSVIADEGVRKIGVFGLPKSGREFDLKYKKSLHITTTPFSEAFRDDFVNIVNNVYESSGLKVVFQGVIGGGDFSANAQNKTTHMQRRDALVQLVFDIFYEDGYESAAEDFQQSMKGLLSEYSGGLDLRMLWGSFEDKGTNGVQLDMSLTATQDLYYDSGDEYARLQQIKKYTDPKDLFYTSFNVQEPD